MSDTPSRCLLSIAALVLGASSARAQVEIPYPSVPDWISVDSDYSTGCAFGDLDRDGWQDLVVSNGNDMSRQRVKVYYNRGDGTFPTAPDWSSGDIDYHGHLSIGDVNGDGWLDVAVSTFLGAAGFSAPGRAKLYLNNGSGTLLSTPSWLSQDTYYSFSLALGDADGDGDLDLAVATGEPYYHSPNRNRIYFNSGGSLAVTPGWLSNELDHTMDLAWGDMNGDGHLDLVSCNDHSPLRIHYGTGSGLSTTAGWSSTSPALVSGNSLSLGDINRDGALDIVFSDNSQLGGSGRFMAYLSNGSGGLGTTPAWQSLPVGYVSGVVLCDVQGDGWLDVIGGSWWGTVNMYLSGNGTLAAAPALVSSTSSVVEALPLGDPDRRGVATVLGETHAGNGQRKVFQLAHVPALSLDAVRVDGAPLAYSQYTYEPETGWVSVAVAPAAQVEIDYSYTTSVDFAVSNWDTSVGNYVFRRRDLLSSSYCHGYGGSGACPCGNASAAGSGEGCRNSTGSGALVLADGSSSVGRDDLVLRASQLPAARSALLFAGTGTLGGGSGVVLGDGLRCVGGFIVRFDVLLTDGNGVAIWGPGLRVKGGWNAGDQREFQVWYRDPGGPCSSGLNLSNALQVRFLP